MPRLEHRRNRNGADVPGAARHKDPCHAPTIRQRRRSSRSRNDRRRGSGWGSGSAAGSGSGLARPPARARARLWLDRPLGCRLGLGLGRRLGLDHRLGLGHRRWLRRRIRLRNLRPRIAPIAQDLVEPFGQPLRRGVLGIDRQRLPGERQRAAIVRPIKGNACEPDDRDRVAGIELRRLLIEPLGLVEHADRERPLRLQDQLDHDGTSNCDGCSRHIRSGSQ